MVVAGRNEASGRRVPSLPGFCGPKERGPLNGGLSKGGGPSVSVVGAGWEAYL